MRFSTAAVLTALCLTTTGLQAATFTETKLLASDGASRDYFGDAVAISGTTAIVGAYGDDNYTGSAYLIDTTTGTQLAKLIASDGASQDQFGSSVAISGTTAIVGSYGGRGVNGSAYLFNTITGDQIAKLTASDGASQDEFGRSVAISGTAAIVGASGDDDNTGSAYLFDTLTGTQLAKLTASGGATDEAFGYSVAISGTTAIVGAWGDDDNGFVSGAAYLFDTITGTQIAKLTASDGAERDLFGYSVAISGTTAIVGAIGDDDNTGSAYLFDTLTGTQIAKLTASDGALSDGFGGSVAISGTTAIVGAGGDDDNGLGSGSAYLFDTLTGTEIAKLTASDGALVDSFGSSVAISGTTAIVGAYGDDDNGDSSGAAYLYAAPVPLPAAAWLLLGGVSALTALRRRKTA